MGWLLAHEDILKRFNEKALEQTFQAKLKFYHIENKMVMAKIMKKEKHHIIVAGGEEILKIKGVE